MLKEKIAITQAILPVPVQKCTSKDKWPKRKPKSRWFCERKWPIPFLFI